MQTQRGVVSLTQPEPLLSVFTASSHSPVKNPGHLNGDYKAYQQFLDRKVVVTGELTQGFTVHHKTAVLIDVRDIKLAE
jgi:hypothetical protein